MIAPSGQPVASTPRGACIAADEHCVKGVEPNDCLTSTVEMWCRLQPLGNLLRQLLCTPIECAAGLFIQPIAHSDHLAVRLLNALKLALDDVAHARGQVFIQRLLVSLDGVLFAGFDGRQDGVVAAAQG